MFHLVYANSQLKQEIENPRNTYPLEVCEEIVELVAILKKHGQLSRTDFFDVNTHRISGRTLFLFYRPQVSFQDKKEVLIVGLKIKPADVFRQRFTILDDWDDKDVLPSIPQYDDPKKILKAIQLIHQGTVDSYEIGAKLGHRGKKDEYIRRHGNYVKHALEELKIIKRFRDGNSHKTYLTEKGKLMAEASNEKRQVELLVRAMLDYPPIWQIISAVTHRAGDISPEKVLTDDLIKNLIFPEIIQQSDTSNRRSQTLRRWIQWISISSGIPIWICNEGLQLPIPMLYSEASIFELS